MWQVTVTPGYNCYYFKLTGQYKGYKFNVQFNQTPQEPPTPTQSSCGQTQTPTETLHWYTEEQPSFSKTLQDKVQTKTQTRLYEADNDCLWGFWRGWMSQVPLERWDCWGSESTHRICWITAACKGLISVSVSALLLMACVQKWYCRSFQS